MAVFLIVLGALSIVAYAFFARSTHEMLEPLLGLPEGQSAYAAAMRRVVGTIVLFDLPLAAIVGAASYILARVSVAPLVRARQREERFAADAAHELRTPLATIAAVAQAAGHGDESARSRALDVIAETAIEASVLLADLLTLMRDAPDDSRLHEPVDFGSVIDGVVSAARLRGGEIGVEFTRPAEAAYAIGEPRALRQLAKNLIDNALRHARSRVAVTVGRDAREIVLRVEDDGDGVAAADRERIFERFFKADPNGPGTGLGLAIARHIAVRHGGSLTLDGAACFVARLPSAS